MLWKLHFHSTYSRLSFELNDHSSLEESIVLWKFASAYKNTPIIYHLQCCKEYEIHDKQTWNMKVVCWLYEKNPLYLSFHISFIWAIYNVTKISFCMLHTPYRSNLQWHDEIKIQKIRSSMLSAWMENPDSCFLHFRCVKFYENSNMYEVHSI